MRHYLLTRCAYGPEIDPERNRRRLDILEGVTARSLRAQTTHDITWLVLVDQADPLLTERMGILASVPFQLVTGDPKDIIRDDRSDVPWGPWADYIDWSEPVLTTRIDDDDAFAPWVLERYRHTAESFARRRPRPIVWTMPNGYRLWNGLISHRDDSYSQFSSLYAPRNKRATIMDINHSRVRKLGAVRPMTHDRGWLWLRHDNARSHTSKASMIDRELMQPVSEQVRQTFDIDWQLVSDLP